MQKQTPYTPINNIFRDSKEAKQLLRSAGFTTTDNSVYISICQLHGQGVNKDGSKRQCKVSEETIAELAFASRNTAITSIKKLERLGLIRVERKFGEASIYTVEEQLSWIVDKRNEDLKYTCPNSIPLPAQDLGTKKNNINKEKQQKQKQGLVVVSTNLKDKDKTVTNTNTPFISKKELLKIDNITIPLIVSNDSPEATKAITLPSLETRKEEPKSLEISSSDRDPKETEKKYQELNKYNFNIAKAVLLKLIANFGVDQVQRNLDYTKNKIEQGKQVNNPNAYARTAIENDYAGNEKERVNTKETEKEYQEKLCALIDKARQFLLHGSDEQVTPFLLPVFNKLEDYQKEEGADIGNRYLSPYIPYIARKMAKDKLSGKVNW